MPDLVPVRVRDCTCPDSPHAEEGDLVFLLPTLPFDGGILAEQQMIECAQAGDNARLVRLWARTFTEYGAVGWNLVDEDGPVPFDVSALFADWRFARSVADKAADLYGESVMDPFLAALEKRSPKSPTEPTTSPRPRRTRQPSASL